EKMLVSGKLLARIGMPVTARLCPLRDSTPPRDSVSPGRIVTASRLELRIKRYVQSLHFKISELPVARGPISMEYGTKTWLSAEWKAARRINMPPISMPISHPRFRIGRVRESTRWPGLGRAIKPLPNQLTEPCPKTSLSSQSK